MKPRLLLYITAGSNPVRNLVAATFAWVTQAAGWHFEVYYDSYRLGEHYGGGDPSAFPPGLLTGGTVMGAHHHERLYLVLHRFDTLVVTQGDIAFDATLRNIGARRLCLASTEDAYDRVFAYLGIDLPQSVTIVDSAPHPPLAGIEAYSYPEIVGHHSLGFEASAVTEDTVRWFVAHDVRAVQTLWLGPGQREHVDRLLAAVGGGAHPLASETVDSVDTADTFQTMTERIADRWHARFTGGWMLADPVTVSAWLPEAVREGRLAVYGKPQRDIIRRLRTQLQASTAPVLGRQYEDADFFDLSALGVAFQLIDPDRPPFPVLRQAGYEWAEAVLPRSPSSEPDDGQLLQWAREGRVLTSIIFWTGMIRELENLPRIVDLVALTRLKAGIALTVPALEYQPEGPLELLRVPLECGGVYPYLEILLASCGLGASIESRMPPDRLNAYLAATNRRIEDLAIPRQLRPIGWWTTMDPDLRPLPRPKLRITPQLSRHAPFARLRYESSGAAGGDSEAAPLDGTHPAPAVSAGYRRRRVAAWARSHGLEEVLAPYRPYERFAPGDLRPDIVDAARAAGMRYVFSKAGFGAGPRVLALYDDFIAMNYTAGRWDGWTPFETINDIADLRTAERRLLALRKPGWLVGTLDSCLWTFTGPVWRRGAALFDVASFLAAGGDTGRLINVTPRVVARYARTVAALQDPALNGAATEH